MEGAPEIIRGYVPSTSSSRSYIKTIQIHFGPKEVHYLGHVLSVDGIRISEHRIKAIVDVKTPTNIKELCSVLGTINFGRKFIPNFATIIDPLFVLTRKAVANEDVAKPLET